jgi:hypothetical protein
MVPYTQGFSFLRNLMSKRPPLISNESQLSLHKKIILHLVKTSAKAVQGIRVPEQACSCSFPYTYIPIGALKIVIYSTKDL